MTRFLIKLFFPMVAISRCFHEVSGQFSGDQWWNSVNPWNPPTSDGQGTNSGGPGVGVEVLNENTASAGGDSWHPNMDPHFETLGVVGPSGITVVSDAASETTGNAQNNPERIPPPNEIGTHLNEQTREQLSDRQNSVTSDTRPQQSLTAPQQTTASSEGTGLVERNAAAPPGRGRSGRRGRRRNRPGSQNRASIPQAHGTSTLQRGSERSGTGNTGTIREVSSSLTESNSGGQHSQNSGQNGFSNTNNRRLNQRNDGGAVNSNNPGTNTNARESAVPNALTEGGSQGSNSVGSSESPGSSSSNAGHHQERQHGTGAGAHGDHAHAHGHDGHVSKQCDGKGGVVKDSSGKITHVIDRHDCSLLEVIDSPLTGGHVVDPRTGELMFAVEQKSFLVDPTQKPPKINRRPTTHPVPQNIREHQSSPPQNPVSAISGHVEPGVKVANSGLSANERQRIQEQRRKERLHRQKQKQQRRQERRQRQMEKQRLRQERLARKQERQQARMAAANTPPSGGTLQRNVQNLRNMGGRNTPTTTPTTTTTPTSTTTPTTTTTTTTPAPRRPSRRSRLQRIARPLNRQLGNLLSSFVPGLNQQLRLAPPRRRTNVRRPRMRKLNFGGLFNLFG